MEDVSDPKQAPKHELDWLVASIRQGLQFSDAIEYMRALRDNGPLVRPGARPRCVLFSCRPDDADIESQTELGHGLLPLAGLERTEAFDKLLAAGLVERQGEVGGVTFYRLTSEARAYLEQIDGPADEQEKGL